MRFAHTTPTYTSHDPEAEIAGSNSMVNNAGIGLKAIQSPIRLMPDSTFDTVMAINARGVFLGIKHAIAQFLAQDPHPSGHRGWIVNTSSIMGLVGNEKNGAAYCASKGAVTLLTKQVAVEYAKVKVHCDCICPGREFPLPYLLPPSVGCMRCGC